MGRGTCGQAPDDGVTEGHPSCIGGAKDQQDPRGDGKQAASEVVPAVGHAVHQVHENHGADDHKSPGEHGEQVGSRGVVAHGVEDGGQENTVLAGCLVPEGIDGGQEDERCDVDFPAK